MIFYFSATGNSYYVAKRIADAINTPLISITDAMRSNSYSYELEPKEKIGIVFPTYCFGLPSVIIDFIEKLKLEGYNSNYMFLAATGGGTCAETHVMAEKLLKKRNLSPNAFYEVILPDNFITYFNLMPPPEKRDKQLNEASGKVDEIIKLIKVYTKNNPPRSIGRWIWTNLTYPAYKLMRKTKQFNTNENCTYCGQCEKLCPTSCIKVDKVAKTVVWQHPDCSHCLACIHRCPTKAINFSNKTQSRGRYTNPILNSRK